MRRRRSSYVYNYSVGQEVIINILPDGRKSIPGVIKSFNEDGFVIKYSDGEYSTANEFDFEPSYKKTEITGYHDNYHLSDLNGPVEVVIQRLNYFSKLLRNEGWKDIVLRPNEDDMTYDYTDPSEVRIFIGTRMETDADFNKRVKTAKRSRTNKRKLRDKEYKEFVRLNKIYGVTKETI